MPFQILKNFNHSQKFPILYNGFSCGLFNISEDHIEESLSVNDLFQNDKESIFFAKASGDSMFPEIKNGDIIAINTSLDPKNGDYVALYLNDQATCKVFLIKGKQVILKSINEKYKDIYINSFDEFRIFGVIEGIIRLKKPSSISH